MWQQLIGALPRLGSNLVDGTQTHLEESRVRVEETLQAICGAAPARHLALKACPVKGRTWPRR
jgi:hypothetical protein